MDNNRQIPNFINSIKQGIAANIIKGGFPGGAAEGTIHTWKDGSSYKKQGGTWVPVKDGKKGGKKDDGKSKTPTAAAPAAGKDGQTEQASKHDLAQLTHMKEVMEADPAKAYEIFQSLEPAAQHMVPQDVVNKLVRASHTDESKEGASFDDLGKDGKKDENKGFGSKADAEYTPKKTPEVKFKIEKEGQETLDLKGKDKAEIQSWLKKFHKDKYDGAKISEVGKKEPAKKAENKGSDQTGTKSFLVEDYKLSKEEKSALESKTSKMYAKDGKMDVYEGDKKVVTIDYKKLEKKVPEKKMTSKDHLAEADAWAKELSDPTEKSLGMTMTEIDEEQAMSYRLHEITKKKEDAAKGKKEPLRYGKSNKTYEELYGKNPVGHKHSTEEATASLKKNGHKSPTDAMISKEQKSMNQINDNKPSEEQLQYFGKNKEAVMSLLVEDPFLTIKGAVEEHQKDLKKGLHVAELHNQAEIGIILKGGKALPIGTKRTHGGVEVVKTAQGWKFDASGRKPAANKSGMLEAGSFKVGDNIKYNGMDAEVTHVDTRGAGQVQVKTEKGKYGFSFSDGKVDGAKVTRKSATKKEIDNSRTMGKGVSKEVFSKLKSKFVSVGQNKDGFYVRGSGNDFTYVQMAAKRDLGIEMKKTDSKSLKDGNGHFFEVTKEPVDSKSTKETLAHTKEINSMKEKRNKLKAGSLMRKDLQAKIDKMEARVIRDKDGRSVGVKPLPEKPSLPEGGVKSGSTDVRNITSKYTFMKNQLKGVTGDVDFVIVKRDTTGMRGTQDKYRIELHQNGKVVGHMGSTPSNWSGGRLMSDNYPKIDFKKDTWRDHLSYNITKDIPESFQKMSVEGLKSVVEVDGKKANNAMLPPSVRNAHRERISDAHVMLGAHAKAEKANAAHKDIKKSVISSEMTEALNILGVKS